MTDRYKNFAELAAGEIVGEDYQIEYRLKSSALAIFAIHGGYIEHATQSLANHIAADDFSYYTFSGLQDNCQHLHITSNNFDEPTAIKIAESASIVISIHGAYGQQEITWLGGLNEELKRLLIEKLNENGFAADYDPSPNRQGKGKSNICNRGQSREGVQLELPQGMRKSLFIKPDYNNPDWIKNERYNEYVSAIRSCLLAYQATIQ